MMSGVTLWLNVVPGSACRGQRPSELWTAFRDMPHLPNVGDEMILWPSLEYDPTEGPQWPVRRRFWDASGHAHLELCNLVLDPDLGYADEIRAAGLRDIQAGRQPSMRSWNTQYDGDPRVGLRRGRWERYGV